MFTKHSYTNKKKAAYTVGYTVLNTVFTICIYTYSKYSVYTVHTIY